MSQRQLVRRDLFKYGGAFCYPLSWQSCVIYDLPDGAWISVGGMGISSSWRIWL
jgi:hypothetical protein